MKQIKEAGNLCGKGQQIVINVREKYQNVDDRNKRERFWKKAVVNEL